MNIEDEATNFCEGKRHYLRLSELMFDDQSPSLSIRGHPCSSQHFILPIKSEKFIGSELTLVSAQLTFSLDEQRDRSPARLNF